MGSKKSKSPSISFALRLMCMLLLTLGVVTISPQKGQALTNPNTQSTGLQAEIPANPPTIPATITFPGSLQTTSALPMKVGGTCSGDVLVKLFANGVFVGSAVCKNGTYSLSIDLFTGKNDIVARVYDALNQVGPDSALTSVTFTPTGFNTSGPRVSLTSDYAKRGANPGDDLVWPIVLSGGVAPYALSIDWGDGTTELISRPNNGTVELKHKYAKPGTYTVIVKSTDANGNTAFMQLVAVANGALAQDNQSTNASAATTKVVVLWWPVIVAGVLVVFSFWLGARNKLELLRRQAEKRINY